MGAAQLVGVASGIQHGSRQLAAVVGCCGGYQTPACTKGGGCCVHPAVRVASRRGGELVLVVILDLPVGAQLGSAALGPPPMWPPSYPAGQGGAAQLQGRP